MKIQQNDKVKIISGKDRGKEGKVIKVFKDEGKISVEGINVVKKHVKPGTLTKEGGIVSIEKPIDWSNAMVVCSSCKLPTRVSFSVVKSKKYRICKKCGEVIGK